MSNLRRDAQIATVQFNLNRLGLRGKKLDVFNPLTDESVTMTADGKLSVPLGSGEIPRFSPTKRFCHGLLDREE